MKRGGNPIVNHQYHPCQSLAPSTCTTPKSPRGKSAIAIANASDGDGTHRRTVSFPDHVLQKQSPNGMSPGSGPDRQHLYPYHDFNLESDDPALFSLVSATQARSNGRVFIATDVDPVLVSPAVLSLQSASGGEYTYW